MDDEKGLDLSLGLPCGPNSSSHKGEVNSSEIKSSEDDRDVKMINEFKNFLDGGNQLKFGVGYCGQYDAKASPHMETSKNLYSDGGNWLTNESKSTDFEDEGRSVVCEKRKNMFTKMDPKKKHAAEVNLNHGYFTDNAKGSHIMIGDEGSTGKNENVADSETHVVSSGDVSDQKDGFGDVSIPYGVQPATMSLPFSQAIKDLKASGTLCHPTYSLPGIVHTLTERSSIRPVHQSNFSLTNGYSSTQLPTLVRDNSKDGTGQNQEATTLPSEFQAIRPGIAAELKFGGSGSYPNLPWVSTTSPNPNGRTISGVSYRYSPTQIKIVCACHGSHMSPDEFVLHAYEDAGDSALPSLPSSNPAASAGN